jgi:hypothetical protein
LSCNESSNRSYSNRFYRSERLALADACIFLLWKPRPKRDCTLFSAFCFPLAATIRTLARDASFFILHGRVVPSSLQAVQQTWSGTNVCRPPCLYPA